MGAQSYEDWPEFEVVEPLDMQPIPRPVKVQCDIKKTGDTAAKGDSLEVRGKNTFLIICPSSRSRRYFENCRMIPHKTGPVQQFQV